MQSAPIATATIRLELAKQVSLVHGWITDKGQFGTRLRTHPGKVLKIIIAVCNFL